MADIDRPMPQNLVAETAALFCILTGDDRDRTFAFDKLKDATYFYDSKNQTVFLAMRKMYDEDRRIDSITLVEYLQNKNQIAEAGGAYHIASIAGASAFTNNLGTYCSILHEKYTARQIIMKSNEAIERAFEMNQATESIVDDVTDFFYQLRFGSGAQGFTHMRDAVYGLMTDLETAITNGTTPGLKSGFTDLDGKTGGFFPGELWYIGARPGMGKTAFLLAVAQNLAFGGFESAVFSLEMSKRALAMRTAGDLGKQPVHNIRNLKEFGFSELKSMMVNLSQKFEGLGNIWVDDTPALTSQEIFIRAKKLKIERPQLKVIFVDYLQIVNADKSRNRYEDVTYISSKLKTIAKVLDVTLVSLSQLSRNVEQRENKMPELSDLRESGAIEQDADVICFLYRPEYYNAMDRPGEADVIIAKQRQGPVGTITLGFQKEFTRFVNLDKRYNGQMPNQPHWNEKESLPF